jgi:hypothetical protein
MARETLGTALEKMEEEEEEEEGYGKSVVALEFSLEKEKKHRWWRMMKEEQTKEE